MKGFGRVVRIVRGGGWKKAGGSNGGEVPLVMVVMGDEGSHWKLE